MSEKSLFTEKELPEKEKTIFFKFSDLPLALKKEGFGLELEVKKIFEKISGKDSVFHNYSIDGVVLPEIDIYAVLGSGPNEFFGGETYHFVVECKSADSESELYLNENTEDREFEEFHYIVSKNKQLIRLADYDNQDLNKRPIPVYIKGDDAYKHHIRTSYRGVFYTNGKKADINYERSHIFKGEKQLVASCSTLSAKSSYVKDGNFIIPLIVTDRNVKIVDYSSEKVYMVPWALNKISSSNRDLSNYIPYTIICSLNYLEDFLQSVVNPNQDLPMRTAGGSFPYIRRRFTYPAKYF